MIQGNQIVKHVSKVAMVAVGAFIGAPTSWADTLSTHRLPAALAIDAASETTAAAPGRVTAKLRSRSTPTVPYRDAARRRCWHSHAR